MTILEDVKAYIGSYDPFFDASILMHINVQFAVLRQIGLCKNVREITDASKWDDLDVSEDTLALIKTYVQNRVRLAFDPNASAQIAQAFEAVAEEAETRLYWIAENYIADPEQGDSNE